MNSKDIIIHSAIASVFALGIAATSAQAAATEKCAGVVKAGKNDCGTSISGCHGSVNVDSHKEAWIELPKGSCEKIVGAHVTTSPYAKPGGKAN